MIDAINSANTNTEDDIVNLNAGTYVLTDSNTEGVTGLPSITSNIAINGEGAESTIIERDASAHPFRILQVSDSGDLAIDGLTISGGLAKDNINEPGGGIMNYGILTITNCIISNNQARSGGGIWDRGTATIINSTISNNTAYGIYSVGGGILRSVAETMTIDNCTISGNRAEEAGGGIFNDNPSEPTALNITNSTFYDNHAQYSGAIAHDLGLVTITNSTISGNTATYEGGGIGYFGGEEFFMLLNTIVAGNTAPNGPDCSVEATSLGNNLIGDLSGCTITPQDGDLFDVLPGLGPFTDNGTPGGGHLPLLPASQAIDGGNHEECLPTDQIGQSRADGDGDGTIICDIGAIELQPTNEPPVADAGPSLTISKCDQSTTVIEGSIFIVDIVRQCCSTGV